MSGLVLLYIVEKKSKTKMIKNVLKTTDVFLHFKRVRVFTQLIRDQIRQTEQLLQ